MVELFRPGWAGNAEDPERYPFIASEDGRRFVYQTRVRALDLEGDKYEDAKGFRLVYSITVPIILAAGKRLEVELNTFSYTFAKGTQTGREEETIEATAVAEGRGKNIKYAVYKRNGVTEVKEDHYGAEGVYFVLAEAPILKRFNQLPRRINFIATKSRFLDQAARGDFRHPQLIT